jgi:Cu(I)/Ag(I) efflux system periplasmic protein CusF
MHIETTLAFAVVLSAAPLAAVAQAPERDAYHLAAAAADSSAMTEGEVRKVDKDAAKITLRHGDIKSLDMPPMTMVFQVKDKAMLDKVKAGDKVRFTAEKAGGALTITAIEPAK